jgi:hypothetical protein
MARNRAQNKNDPPSPEGSLAKSIPNHFVIERGSMDAEHPGGLLPIPVQRSECAKDQESLVDLEVFFERSETGALSVVGKEEVSGTHGPGEEIRIDIGFPTRSFTGPRLIGQIVEFPAAATRGARWAGRVEDLGDRSAQLLRRARGNEPGRRTQFDRLQSPRGVWGGEEHKHLHPRLLLSRKHEQIEYIGGRRRHDEQHQGKGLADALNDPCPVLGVIAVQGERREDRGQHVGDVPLRMNHENPKPRARRHSDVTGAGWHWLGRGLRPSRGAVRKFCTVGFPLGQSCTI